MAKRILYVASLFAALLFTQNAFAAAAQRARIDFPTAGVATGSLITGLACAGGDNEICNFVVSGTPLVVMYDGASTTPGFIATTTGLTLGLDSTDDEGAEVGFNTPAIGNGPCVFTVGTSPAFYVKAKLKITTVADYDTLAVGFRKVEAHQDLDDPADFNTTTPLYADYAFINANAGDYHTFTSVGGATAVDTDITTTSWADAASHTLTVKVSSAGVTTYQIDGVAATGAVAYTFTNGAVLVPAVEFGVSASSAGTDPEFQLMECGLQ